MSKKEPMSKRRPLQWIEDATPEEIAEALLAVDEEKAYRVALYLGSRLPPEIARISEHIEHEIRRDPGRALGRMLGGALSRLGHK